MKWLAGVLVALILVGCNCEKKVLRFNKKTFKQERKLLEKGCISLKKDSIPTSDIAEKLPDTIKTQIFVKGPTIRDTFRIECDEEGNVVYSGRILQGGVLTTSVKCPDLDSVISIYNENKVKETTRANYCCDGWDACEAKRVQSLNVDTCGFWCKTKFVGAGAIGGMILMVVLYIINKVRGIFTI